MQDLVHVTYEQTGESQQQDTKGMRAMQRRVFKERGSQYLLVKAPPASGKSRALMFVGLDKLENQGVKKIIVAVPEKSIGNSFRTTNLTSGGFFTDWVVDSRWNLCTDDPETRTVEKGKVQAFKSFLTQPDKILVCTHATLRFAFDELGAEPFDGCVLAVDEFHHASAHEENRLGEVVRALVERDKAHIVAMTGSYFRGDAEMVLRPEDEAKFTRVTYTYFEQLNGYEHLKSLGIGYHFYKGVYLDSIAEVLDTNKKTIIHIPHTAAAESTKDKYGEVCHILDAIGDYKGVDAATGFYLVQSGDRLLRVADLVEDDPEKRMRVQASLRKLEDRDAVDIIIAMGMAKEGFDWVWCEHALTVGYRSSLTEIIQIIGRATRDAPHKVHAQFTNLIAEPDATQDTVISAVNDMLKAISASLLMEQVMAPKFKFYTRKDPDSSGGSDDAEVEIDSDTGEIHIGIKGFKEPSTDRVRQIVEEDINDLVAAVCQETALVTQASANPHVSPQELNKVLIPRVIEGRYLDLSSDEEEEVRQQLVARMNIVAKANDEARKSGRVGILDMIKKFINVQDLNIDLIDSINPFQQAYEVLSKSLDSKTLAQIQEAIAGKKVNLTEEDVVNLFPKLQRFVEQHKRQPSLNSADPVERVLAEARAWLVAKKRERQQQGAAQ